MASPSTKAGFPDALQPDFREVTLQKFNEIEDPVGKMFTIKSSDRHSETVSAIGPMGDLPKFTGTLSYDGPDQMYDVTAVHVEFAGGVQIQRALYDDDQFDVINDFFGMLGRAGKLTRLKDAYQLLNNAFSIDNEFYNHTEGVGLCSNSHTSTRAGVSTSSGFDNLSTAGLSATALTADVITFRQFADNAGEPIDIEPNEIYAPINLEDQLSEIIKTRFGLDTAEGNVNVHDGRFTVKTSVRLSDTNNYFLCNSSLRKEALYWYDRIPFETGKMESFDQYTAKGRAYMRYSFLYKFWQFILGHEVS